MLASEYGPLERANGIRLPPKIATRRGRAAAFGAVDVTFAALDFSADSFLESSDLVSCLAGFSSLFTVLSSALVLEACLVSDGFLLSDSVFSDSAKSASSSASASALACALASSTIFCLAALSATIDASASDFGEETTSF